MAEPPRRPGAAVLVKSESTGVACGANSPPLILALGGGGRLVALGWLDSLHVFSRAEEGQPLVPTPLAPTGVVRSLCIDPTGRFLLSGGDDKTVRAWDLGSHTMLGSWVHSKKIGCVAFAPDSEGTNGIGLFADKFGEVFTVNLKDFGAAPVLKLGHLSPVSHLVFTPSGRNLITCDREGHVRASVWPHSDIIDRYFMAHKTSLQVVLPLVTAPLLFTTTVNGAEVCIWELETAICLEQYSAADLRDSMDGRAARPGDQAITVRCACECVDRGMIATGFSNDCKVYFASVQRSAAGALQPKSELSLTLRSVPLALKCSDGERQILCVLNELDLVCFDLAKSGMDVEAIPTVSFSVSSLPAPAALTREGEAAATGEEEGEEQD